MKNLIHISRGLVILTKTGYKITEIGELPEDWKVVSFDQAFRNQKSTPKKVPTSKFKEKGKFPIVDQGKNLISGYTDDEGILYKGDFPLIVFGDHTLCVKYVDFRFAVGADGTKLLTPNYRDFTSKFLYYVILGMNLKSEGYKRHFSKLRKQYFQCPDRIEQQKIAEILTTADREIELTDREILATEKLKKGLMQKLLTRGIGHTKFKMTEIGEIPEEWDISNLERIGKIVTGGTPSTSNENYWNGNIPWIASGDIHQRYIDKPNKFITNEGLENSNCSLLPIDTVLIALNGQGKTRGLSALLKITATCNQSLAGIIIEDSRMNAIYLFYQLSNRYKEIRNLSGTGRNGLNLSHIKNIVVPIPEMVEQTKTVEILMGLDSKIKILIGRKEKAEDLKRGLMQILLTGKVRVKADSQMGDA